MKFAFYIVASLLLLSCTPFQKMKPSVDEVFISQHHGQYSNTSAPQNQVQMIELKENGECKMQVDGRAKYGRIEQSQNQNYLLCRAEQPYYFKIENAGQMVQTDEKGKSMKNFLTLALKAAEVSVDGRWQIIQINNQNIERKAASDMVYLDFKSNIGRFSGFTGCNQVSGNFKVVGANLNFNEVISTEKYCEKITWEGELMQIFNQVERVDKEGDKLMLCNSTEKILVTLVKVP